MRFQRDKKYVYLHVVYVKRHRNPNPGLKYISSRLSCILPLTISIHLLNWLNSIGIQGGLSRRFSTFCNQNDDEDDDCGDTLLSTYEDLFLQGRKVFEGSW